MSNQVDSRIVEMEFRNGSFEKGISQTLSSLKNLDSALELKNAAHGFEGITKAASAVSLDSISQSLEQIAQHFTTMGQVADVVLQRITNAAINTGKNLLNSFLINPAKQGMEEYAQELTSVQTLTNATGASVADVRKTLDVLNTYADKTIYSFGDMTSSLSKFTNAGIELPKAEKAIRGISNAAAHAGAGTQQASSAMYNFSQALSTGYMGLMDWRSISNTANIGTTSFKQTLLDMGVAMGTLVKTEEGYISTTTGANGKTAEAFELSKGWDASLNSQWMSTDVMTKALEVYGTDVRELTEDEKAKYEQGLKDLGLTDEQIKRYEELGIKAADSAQEVKTFAQMIDVTKEAIGSGWARTWKIIFGDLDEAKKLFTGATNAIGDVIGKIADWRNGILQAWVDAGGREDLINSIASAWNGLIRVLERVTGAYRAILGPITGQLLAQVSNGIKMFVNGIGDSVKYLENFEQGVGGIFVILRALGNVALVVAKIAFPPLAAALSVTYNALMLVFGTLGRVARWIYNIVDLGLKPLGTSLNGIIEGINKISSSISGKLNSAIRKLTIMVREFDFLHFSKTSWLKEWIHKTFDPLLGWFFALSGSLAKIGGEIGRSVQRIFVHVGDVTKAALSTIGALLRSIGSVFMNVVGLVMEALRPFSSVISSLIEKIGNTLSSVLRYIRLLSEAAIVELLNKVKSSLSGVNKVLNPITKILYKIGGIVATFAGKGLNKLIEGLMAVSERLVDANTKLRRFFSGVKSGHTSALTPLINALNKAKTAVSNFVKSLDISGKIKSALTGLNAIKNAIADSFKVNINPGDFLKDIKKTFDRLKLYISTNGLFKGGFTKNLADLKEVGDLGIFGIMRAFQDNIHIGNVFSDIGGMLKAAASEFGAFVKAKIPEKLIEFREAFKSFAIGLWDSAKTNIPKALTAIKNGIKDLPGTIDKLKTSFNNWKANVELPEWLQKVIDKIKDFVAQHSTLKNMLDILKNAGESIKDFGKSIIDVAGTKFGGLINGFKSIIDKIKGFIESFKNIKETISDTVSGVISKVKEFVANINWDRFFDLAKLTGFGVIVLQIKSFVEGFNSVTESISSVPEALSGAIETIGDTFEAVGEAESARLKAESFKALAQALLTAAGALFIIAQIKPDDLYRAAIVAAIIAAVGVAVMKSFTTFTDARTAAVEAETAATEVAGGAVSVAQTLQGPLKILAKGIARAATFIGLGVFVVGIGVTFALIVGAFKTLCENEAILKNAGKAMGIMFGLFLQVGVLAGVLAVLNGRFGGLSAGSGAFLVLLAFAIKQLVKIVEVLGNTPWDVALRGLGFLLIMMGELGGLAFVMSTYGAQFATMSKIVKTVANAMLKLMLVVEIIGHTPDAVIEKGEFTILKLSLIIAGLAAVMSLIATKIGGVEQLNKLAKALTKMAKAIAILGAVAAVLSIFSKIGDMGGAVTAIFVLAVVLGALTGALALFSKMGPDAVASMIGLASALILVAGAVAIMSVATVALALLGDRLWPAIGAIAALSGILVVFLAVVSVIAIALGPGILAISALTTALGMLFLGLAAFLAGLSVFVITITTFGERFVDAIFAIGEKINGRKEEFIQSIANLIEGVVGGIALGIAGAADEILIALEQVAVSIAQHLPEIFYQLAVACVMLTVNVFKGIYDAISKAFPGIWEKIGHGIKQTGYKISQGWHDIISGLEGFLGKIIQWLAEKLSDVPVIGDALKKLGDDMVAKSEANAKRSAEAAAKAYTEETARQTPTAKAATSHQVQEVATTVETEGAAVTQASTDTAVNSTDAFASNFNLTEITSGAFGGMGSTLSQYSQYMPAEMAAMGQNGSNAFGMNFDLSGIAGTEMGDMTAALQGGSVDVESIMSQMGTSGATAATNTEAYANAGADNVSQFVASAVTQGGMSATELTSALQELGYAVPAGFSEGIVAKSSEGETAVSTAMKDAIESGRLALDSHSPSLVFDQMGQDSMAGYAQGVQTGATGAGTALTTAFSTMIESVKSSIPQFEVNTTGIMQGIQKSIESGKPSVNTAMMQVISTVLTSIRQKSRDFYSRGIDIIRNFEQGISSRSGYARSAASGVASAALGGFSAYQGSAYSVGVYMAEGFQNGIMAKANSVANAAAQVALAAINAAKAASEQHSPSRAFFRIGAYDGQGLINGIDSTKDAVYDEGYDLGYAALVGTMAMMDRVSAYLEDNPDFQPTITPVLDLTDLSANADRIRSMIGDILLPTDSIAASMEYRNQENQALVETINRQNTLLGDILTKLNQGTLLDPNRIYEAIRIGASDSHPSIIANNREVTRYFKEIGVAFGG